MLVTDEIMQHKICNIDESPVLLETTITTIAKLNYGKVKYQLTYFRLVITSHDLNRSGNHMGNYRLFGKVAKR